VKNSIKPGKIDGVLIKELKVWKDNPDLEQDIEPGIFMEVLRHDDEMLEKFGQSNFTIANEGTIKAFHWHKKQDDLWFLATGRAAIVLYDQRENSPTKGETEVIYGGTNDYKLVLIPVGVVHGYKVLSKEPCLLFYHVTKAYNPKNPDELRIDPYDKTINFNWESL
jgi:dTDP-4-dehydrorhamnose 3,5-epimerase